MSILNEDQHKLMHKNMGDYLSAPGKMGSSALIDKYAEFDNNRIIVIKNEMLPLLTGYQGNKIALQEFKSKGDSINKRNNYWGFRGMKGQMFFNLIFNSASSFDCLNECDQELKAALTIPKDEEAASSQMQRFLDYVDDLAKRWIAAQNSPHAAPKVSSIPFFLSYFWQIQDRETWPIYYTTDVQVMSDLNLWQPTGDQVQDYILFKRIRNELVSALSKSCKRTFSYYDIEHLFTYLSDLDQQPSVPVLTKVVNQNPNDRNGNNQTTYQKEALPESYIPPIIAILPRVAKNDSNLADAAKQAGTTIDRVFEKYVNAAFTILGYDTKLLGQGKGRVPDGIAKDFTNNYAIIWDSKVRANGYNMGTDDRTIREYIATISRELSQGSFMRHVYFSIISSAFNDDFEDSIHLLKMETEISDITLVEATALVEMVDLKLRLPSQISTGPYGLQRLFSSNDVITAAMVRELFG